jgi:4-alpha-glucanotransferase
VTARTAGLLLHVTSLPGRLGIGDMGPAAERFLAWAESAGLRLWQVLPLGPSGHHGSPYGGLSSFAGNPLFISPERLVEDDLLPAPELEQAPALPPDRVDFDAVESWKARLLRGAWDRFRSGAAPRLRPALEEFRFAPPQTDWLPDWALYAALRDHFQEPWYAWPPEFARRSPEALAEARRRLADEVGFHEFVQLLFELQWSRLRSEAAHRGISILGDVPIYVAHDSADIWANRELFALDDEGRPLEVAGVPPDYFSPTGQLWGYPLYRWDRAAGSGYRWWIARVRASLARADAVRIDHFRAFAAYWSVPAGEETALNGRWVKGPGVALFAAVRKALGDVDIVAEDLGDITPDVRELLAGLGIPGMKVLQFAFSEDDSGYLPHNHVPRCVVYTGTHDNDTARGWFGGASDQERRRALEYLGATGQEIEWDLIRAAYESVAERAVIPAQDVFGLGSEARMNTPALAAGNWTWRARDGEFTAERAQRLRRLAEMTGRLRKKL